MQRKMNKKGFTIVELVIVIVVIAILAAVLIPTFVSLTRKANIANDTAVAKNLNTAAIAAQADTFDEALTAVKDAGYLIANLNAKAKDCYFVWEDDSNQFLLYDLKENKIIYSNTDIDDTPDNSWCFAISDAEMVESVKAALPNVTIKALVANVENLEAWLNKDGEQEIFLDDSFKINDDNYIVLNNNQANVTIDLNGSTVSGMLGDGSPIKVKSGKMTLQNGTITATGNGVDADGNSVYDIVYVVGDDTTNTVVDVENMKLIGSNVVYAISADNGSTVNVKDSTVEAKSTALGAYGGATINASNCTVSASKSVVFASSTGGVSYVNIDGGEYSGTYDLLNAHGGVITIDGGNFSCETQTTLFNMHNVAGGKIVLKDGTFNGVEFEKLDEDTIRGMINTNGGTVSVEKVDGAWVLSIN